ncbi:hypothetical protein QQF64_018380 [Cirrhinus molitorella]|uniref:Uncharacterized protein n=1 Tax=Cirrhinus molitorella TaxID=172907 RepID=A0ABR3LFW8_9TELE
MRETFHYRQKILHDLHRSADVLQMFPRFLDIKGLILQDFSLMFGAEVSSRFLEKWNTTFKKKVIQEAQNLKETALLKQHLKAVLKEASDTNDVPDDTPFQQPVEQNRFHSTTHTPTPFYYLNKPEVLIYKGCC